MMFGPVCTPSSRRRSPETENVCAETQPRGSLDATTLAQYVRLESCERYLWYRLHPKETRELFRDYPRHRAAADAASEREGRAPRERDHRRASRERSRCSSTWRSRTVDATIAELGGGATERARAAAGAGRGNDRRRSRRRVSPISSSSSRARTAVSRITVGDAKASRRDQARAPNPGRVLRAADPPTRRAGRASRSRRWPAASGASRRARTTSSPRCSTSGPTRRRSSCSPTARAGSPQVAAGPREEARFHLTYKCDGCLYNALCMREAAEAESLALVPFMSMRDRGALERHGVTTVRELAALKGLPPKGDYTSPLPGRGATPALLAALGAEWPLGANLDLHVQRARASRPELGPGRRRRCRWIHALGLRDAAGARGVSRTRPGLPRRAARLPRRPALPRRRARRRAAR